MKKLIIIIMLIIGICLIGKAQIGCYNVMDKNVCLYPIDGDSFYFITVYDGIKDTNQITELMGEFGKVKNVHIYSINNLLTNEKLTRASIILIATSTNYIELSKKINKVIPVLVSPKLNGTWYEGVRKGEVYITAGLTANLKGDEGYNYLVENADIHNVILTKRYTDLINKFRYRVHMRLKGPSDINILQLAETLEATGLFKQVNPLLTGKVKNSNSNDPLFNQQWGLKNVGQPQFNPILTGLDVNACEAWAITKGSPDIVVAVVDDGIDKNHQDLKNNIYNTFSYSTFNGLNASVLWPTSIADPTDIKGHGTAVAGIIAAEKDNQNLTGQYEGIAGMAPNCKLMDISNPFYKNIAYANQYKDIAEGIDQAWMNGASVINCSWQIVQNEPEIVDAMNRALTLGRNGLGCIVVVASGNNELIPAGDNSVQFPGSAIPKLLVVGALQPCGARSGDPACGFSLFGSKYEGGSVDVMAPGVWINHTDVTGSAGFNSVGDYWVGEGTSYAAPHVSGLAALILSVNPCLTGQEVRDIIESTCQAVGPYTYEPDEMITGRPNGPWHEEMGYGLIDAEAALKATIQYLQDETETLTGVEHKLIGGAIYAGDNVTPTKGPYPYIVDSGAQVDVVSNKQIVLKKGVHIKAGATFHAYIDDDVSDCTDWFYDYSPNLKRSPTVFSFYEPEQLDELLFAVYPNPSSNTFNIEFSEIQEEVDLVLADVSGRHLTTNKYSGAKKLQLKKPTLPGIYLLSICINGNCQNQKIISLE